MKTQHIVVCRQIALTVYKTVVTACDVTRLGQISQISPREPLSTRGTKKGAQCRASSNPFSYFQPCFCGQRGGAHRLQSFSPRAAMRPPARLTSRPRAATRFWLRGPRLATVLTSPQPTTSLIFMCRMTGPGPILEQTELGTR